ncbi:hypothetical protein GCM10009799_47620 [Nocardiopsis rhodophaea]|uniref:Secreted protein n=1 Tax=Nocardiopsis rhodophaea TaxID=280238 RepID=A0ABN2TMF0_9ACTN
MLMLRAALATTGVIVAALLILILWAQGGLDSAEATGPTSPAGTAVRNDLFTITPHTAEIVTNTDTGGSELRIHADLVSHHTDPVYSTAVLGALEPDLAPAKLETEYGSIAFERRPDSTVGRIQPEMPEKALISWPLARPGGDSDADDESESIDELLDVDKLLEPPDDVSDQVARVDRVTLTVLDAEFSAGFTDQSERWFPGDTTVGRVALALGAE